MTRLSMKISRWFSPRKQQRGLPDHVFWEALLDIQYRYFEEVLDDYVRTGRPRKHIFNSFSTIDCWLDVASENGWMNDHKPTE